MKKVFISMVLMGILMVTGCTSSKETSEKQEDTTIVYCSDCGRESKEVAKFCSECGVEAKWVKEKPEIEEEKITKESEDDNDRIYKDWEYPSNCKVCNSSDVVEEDPGIFCSKCLKLWDNNELTCKDGFSEYCPGCTICLDEFTVEEAISIAEEYYGIKNHPNDYIDADTELKYDSKGMYYKMWAKSKEMIEQGGNGIVFSFKTYEDGTIVEN